MELLLHLPLVAAALSGTPCHQPRCLRLSATPTADVVRTSQLRPCTDVVRTSQLRMTFALPPDHNFVSKEQTWSSQSRLPGLILCVVGSFSAYIFGSDVLNTALVEVLGVSRSSSGSAFGPFVTLLGLVYSVVLSQAYTYHFERQDKIMSAFFQETAALRTFIETVVQLAPASSSHCDLAAADRVCMLRTLEGVSRDTLATAFNERLGDDTHVTAPMLSVLVTLERATSATHPASVRLCANALDRLVSARASRRSAIAAELPPVQTLTQHVISAMLLLGFVLVDLGSPALEGMLFATLAGCFFLVASFLDDLAHPFGGSWSVEPARDEAAELAERARAALADAE